MDRRLLPLLLASDASAGPSEAEPLDRLRMQKGVFLSAKRGPANWSELYSFTPYDWGPYSFDLASMLEHLVADGLLEKEAFPGKRYLRYRTTASGERVIQNLVDQVTAEEYSFVRAIRAYVSTRSFARLLREVYKEYPEFAVNSRFAG